MTDKLREAAQQALEALEIENMACRYEKDPTPEHIAKAITALRAALMSGTDEAESERDWSLLGATQQSLREHMAEIARLRQALEFTAQHKSSDWPERCQQMVDTARAALAEPDVPETDFGNMVEPQVQDSAAWAQVPPAFNDWWDSEYSDPTNPFRLNSAAYWAWAGWRAALMSVPDGAEQEPRFFWDEVDGCLHEPSDTDRPAGCIPLYTAPQPTKQPLTDEEIDQMWSDAHNDTSAISLVKVFARAIERAHGITGENK